MGYVAVDIGASSGRLILGEIINDKLEIREIHRFSNGFTLQDGICHWDMDYLLHEILTGLEMVKSSGCISCTVGIDTWAVDYVLVDQDGKRLQEAVSYRDARTEHTLEKLTQHISKEHLYQKTGIQFLPFNTICQLYEEDKQKLEQAKSILMIPDYLGYCLTGVAVAEITNASTTQLLNFHSRTFDEELLDLLSIRREKWGELTEPGQELGMLRKDWFASYDLPDCKMMIVATHDTASAVIGTPCIGDNWAYLSSGTWSLLGIESDAPIVNERALRNNYSNEWGAFHTTRFLKNRIGMWLIQELRNQLEGDYSYTRLVEEAQKVKAFAQYVNFNDERFLNPDNMMEEIQNYCRETNQQVPVTAGEFANCIYNNLAILYAIALEELEEITGRRIDRLHIVGGGARNEWLNQLTADVSGTAVYAGPAEAAAIGNLLMQMIATKEVADLAEARQLVRSSFDIKEYLPGKMDRASIIHNYKEAVPQ
ncbi:rhamnulokinase [Paenibacillus apiarius]|uniref:rhamnulokinase n=1 Tax=Paenibacillus apiarius TaxID=46240 RepID=UPI003B3B262C